MFEANMSFNRNVYLNHFHLVRRQMSHYKRFYPDIILFLLAIVFFATLTLLRRMSRMGMISGAQVGLYLILSSDFLPSPKFAFPPSY